MDRIDELHLRRAGAPAPAARRYTVGFARGVEAIRAAQRLRWKVFAGELGGRPPGRARGLDEDIFDPYCEHLVVRDNEGGEVVGTYRILPPQAARRIGCYYSETGFDLTRLRPLRDRLVEVGRSCIHPAHRNGTVIALLWSGLARYMIAGDYGYLAGSASISASDEGRSAASIFARLRETHLAPVEYRVFPRRPLTPEDLAGPCAAPTPPLLRGYLSAGAWICGEPSLDPDFNTADLFLLLPIARVNARHARHFFAETERAAA